MKVGSLSILFMIQGEQVPFLCLSHDPTWGRITKNRIAPQQSLLFYTWRKRVHHHPQNKTKKTLHSLTVIVTYKSRGFLRICIQAHFTCIFYTSKNEASCSAFLPAIQHELPTIKNRQVESYPDVQNKKLRVLN